MRQNEMEATLTELKKAKRKSSRMSNRRNKSTEQPNVMIREHRKSKKSKAKEKKKNQSKKR